jgi:hypothetical protein
MLNGILKGNPNARILMSTNKPFCNSQIKRLHNLMGEYDYKKLLFYPVLNISSYINILKLSDVMLDPYPFGGCNTSFEAFDLNIPVVTMPTKYLNGRFTFGMYKKMGFIDMVADSSENYIKIAIKVGSDVKWRDSIKEKINRNKILLFQESESVNNWDQFLNKIYNEKHNLNNQPQPQPQNQLQLPKDQPVKPIDLESWVNSVTKSNIIIEQPEIIETVSNTIIEENKIEETKEIQEEIEETDNNVNLEISDTELINNETINQILEEVMQENLSFDTFIENT